MKINGYTSNTQRKMSSLDDEIFGRDGESMCFNLWAQQLNVGAPSRKYLLASHDTQCSQITLQNTSLDRFTYLFLIKRLIRRQTNS